MPMRHVVAILLCLIVVPGHGYCATPTPGDGGPVIEWIRPEEVAGRADALLRRLEAVRPDAAARATLGKVEAGIGRRGPELDEVLERVSAALARSASPPELEDLRRQLVSTAAPLGGWTKELAGEAQHVAEILDEIVQDERVWSTTRARPETVAAGDVVGRRVDRSLAALGETAAGLRAWRRRVLAASERVLDHSAAVEAALEKLQAAAVAERASLFVPDRAPLWQGLGAGIRRELPRVPQELRSYSRSTREYLEQDPRPFVVHALLAALLMLGFGAFSARARQQLDGKEEAAPALRLLDCPYAIGLLLALLAAPALHPLAPRRLTQLLAMIAILPVARIVIHTSERANLTAFAGLFALLLLDRMTLALAPLPTLARVTFLLTLTLALALAFWFSRRFAGTAPWLRRAANLLVLGVVLAFVAEVGGWSYLATLLGRGAISGAVAAVYIYVAVIALDAALVYALSSRTLRRSHIVGRNAAVLQRRARRGLRWLGAGLWLYFVLTALGLRSATAVALRSLLHAGVSVGALSLSIGDVLAFTLTLLAALLLARIVTGVLEEDVYPRARLPRGVPYALSTLVRYGVYSLGFLLALAAAGVRLSQVALLLGGLGFGIGLGLQDLVKNFAAGLTLLLERRVHVGDTIQAEGEGIFGHVREIGMRATVVRNWDGTEVVVPNAGLVSGAITNWTLSDRLCRIEVAVGVAYGSDPERVVGLLLEAARGSEGTLAEPAPEALFKGFGDSSLDFVVRAWTGEGYERTLPLTSDLALAVHRRLREAGIAIPFPQRDLHLESLSPAVRETLAGRDRKE